jgi:hypothetical protein
MTTDEQSRVAEKCMRSLLESAELPQPDRVQYGDDAIALFWDEQKLVVEIDLRDAPRAELMGRPGFEPGRDGLWGVEKTCTRHDYAGFRPANSA